jgi:predicted transcriptional regulator
MSRMSQPRRLTAADMMTELVVTSGPDDDLTGITDEMQRHNIGLVAIANAA